MFLFSLELFQPLYKFSPTDSFSVGKQCTLYHIALILTFVTVLVNLHTFNIQLRKYEIKSATSHFFYIYYCKNDQLKKIIEFYSRYKS